MTWSTSDVAVCCSSASVRSAVRWVRSAVRWRSSLSSRAFSMAMTACAAKFLTNAICLSVKGELLGGKENAPINSFSFSIGTHKRPHTPKFDGCNCCRIAFG